jgi:hypothetical protein
LESVKIWGSQNRVAGKTKVTITLIIGDDENHVGTFRGVQGPDSNALHPRGANPQTNSHYGGTFAMSPCLEDISQYSCNLIHITSIYAVEPDQAMTLFYLLG